YLLPLEKYGIKIHHDDVQAAWDRIVKHNYHHKVAQFFSMGWPVNFWRIDPLDERDFEWFEAKYPGWYAEYGAFWEAFRRGTDPADGFLPLSFINRAPPFCWTCQGLCVNEPDRRHRIVGDRTRFYCSPECMWMD